MGLHDVLEQLFGKRNKNAFTGFLNLCVKKSPDLEAMLKSRKGEGLVIADVGSGTMPYADQLYSWVEQYAKPRIFAVDLIYAQLPAGNISDYLAAKSTKRISIVGKPIEQCSDYFTSQGIGHIDLFTIFNPQPRTPLPNITKLPQSKGSMVLLTYGEPPEEMFNFRDELEEQGMNSIKQLQNPYSYGIRKMLPACGYDYSPIIIARAP
jgi:hypothetical protein